MSQPSKGTHGQTLIEFALILPLLFLLIVNVVNFGAFLYAGIAVANAARTGADHMMMGPAYAGRQTFASPTVITNLVKDDLKSLPRYATATVQVCSNNNGVKQTPYTDCLATVTDPQPATSVVGTVAVSYRYCPLIPLWEFPALGVHSTLPACNTRNGVTTDGVQVRRVAATRLIQ